VVLDMEPDPTANLSQSKILRRGGCGGYDSCLLDIRSIDPPTQAGAQANVAHFQAVWSKPS
jgi:hypothetical protein